MPVMDEFKEERAALKNGTPKQKLTYFWDYYRWHTIIGCVVIIAAVSFIYQLVTRRDVALYAMLLNGTEINFLADSSENTASFAEYAGIDLSDYDIMYDTSVQLGMGEDYTAAQKLMVYIAASELDVIVSDADVLTSYAYQENFHDLRDFLTPEQIEKYQASFYYIDGAVAREIDAARQTGNYDYTPEYGDPHHPEDMAEPVPAGIFLGEDCPLLTDYHFRGDELVVSALVNTQRPEAASRFIDYLMQ